MLLVALSPATLRAPGWRFSAPDFLLQRRRDTSSGCHFPCEDELIDCLEITVVPQSYFHIKWKLGSENIYRISFRHFVFFWIQSQRESCVIFPFALDSDAAQN